jgi:hypothetical protein
LPQPEDASRGAPLIIMPKKGRWCLTTEIPVLNTTSCSLGLVRWLVRRPGPNSEVTGQPAQAEGQRTPKPGWPDNPLMNTNPLQDRPTPCTYYPINRSFGLALLGSLAVHAFTPASSSGGELAAEADGEPHAEEVRAEVSPAYRTVAHAPDPDKDRFHFTAVRLWAFQDFLPGSRDSHSNPRFRVQQCMGFGRF